MPAVDLNADVGEGFGAYRIGADEELLQWVTSANVACGFHAGDPRVMERTVRLAAERGVGVGAHIGFPDLVGFGRRALAASADEVRTDTLYQLGALAAFCRAAGTRLRHVKAHGALYHQAARDPALAAAVAAAVRAFDAELILVVPPGSELERAALAAGLRVAREGFPDRGYAPDGQLQPRGRPGDLVEDPAEAARRAVRMVREGCVQAVDGSLIPIRVETLCIHGDRPRAVETARAIRQALEQAGVRVVPLSMLPAAGEP